MLRRLFEIRLVRYGVTGATSTAIHLGIAWLYLFFIGQSHYLSNFCGFTIAFIFSYLVQTRYVFGHNTSLRNASRFFIVQSSALLLAALISDMATQFNPYIKVMLTVIILPLITYTIHKFWTFSNKPNATGS